MLAAVLSSAIAEEYPIACWTFMKQEVQRPVEAVVRDWKDLGITHPMSPEFGLKSDKALAVPRDVSVRTALVYEGSLASSVGTNGYLDFIIPASTLLNG